MPAFRFVWAFLAVLAAVACLGVWFHQTQKVRALRRAEENLRLIADFKVALISNWRDERLSDAGVVSDSPFVSAAVAHWLENRDPEAAADLVACLQSIREHYRYSDVFLVSPEAHFLMGLASESCGLHREVAELLAASLRDGGPRFTDLHVGPEDPRPHLGVIAPLFRRTASGAVPLAGVVLVAEAGDFLYPAVEAWPQKSDTAETLLVRQDGDSALFLNELRHRKDSALRFRLPLTRSGLPATAAILGREGIFEGVDYRGVPVVSVLKAVPGSTWKMVAKVDSAEVYADWQFKSVLILAWLLTLSLAASAGIGALWLHRQRGHFRQLAEARGALLESEIRHRMTLLSIGDGVIVTDPRGGIELLNPVAERLTGWSQTGAAGKPIEEIFRIVNEETRAPVENPARRVVKDGVIVGLANHTALLARDGTERPIADSGAPIRDESGNIIGVVLVFRDQTAERASQRALRASEARFRQLTESLPMLCWTCRADGPCDYLSPQWIAYTGIPQEAQLGYGWLDQLHPQDRPRVVAEWQEAVKAETPFDIEFRIRNASGDFRWFQTRAIPLRDAEGNLEKWFGGNVDLHDRKIAEEELRQHRENLEALVKVRSEQLFQSERRLAQEMKATMEIVDEMLSGRLSDPEVERQILNACLDATGSLYGMIGKINDHGLYDTTTYNSRTLNDCAFPEAQARELSSSMVIRGIWGRPLLTGEPFLCNDLHGHPHSVGMPEGHVPITSFLGVPVKRDGRVTGMVAVANKPGGYADIDAATLGRLIDIMAVSLRYRELLTDLESRVKERTAALEAVNMELEAFSYSVSHDLRAPLRAIDGFTRILQEDHERSLNPEGKRVCGVIRDNTGKMGRLIDDLLAFSRLGRAEMHPAQVDMRTLAESIFYEVTDLTARERIDFRVGDIPPATVDPSLIRAVWTNLLANAVKFSSKRDRAEIEVTGGREGGEAVYHIRDNGAGFEMKYVDKLFGVFQRLHRARDFDGTGVGLALVKRIVQRHGGRVWAEGETGRGATFHFALPEKGD